MDLPATFSGRAKQQARLPGRNPAPTSANVKPQYMEDKKDVRRAKFSTKDLATIDDGWLETGVCLLKKNIGKPCTPSADQSTVCTV